MVNLWNKKKDLEFFKRFNKEVGPEKVFYRSPDNKYYAYWPTSYKGKKTTLQSRNAFIGAFTEKFVNDLIGPIANEIGYYSIRGVVCDDIGLPKKSPADVAICKKNKPLQDPEDILLLIEVKMSIVWNWQYFPEKNKVNCIGDFTTHKGNPGLLRSDSMLKAIGKSINIKVSGKIASSIPIIVIGNTPITNAYYHKVDNLKKTGVVQGFYSINPIPMDNDSDKRNLKITKFGGFQRLDNFQEFKNEIKSHLKTKRNFFSSMLDKQELGKIIEIANKEKEYEKKAEVFMSLLWDDDNEK